MTVAAADLAQYEGKKVIVTHNLEDGTAAETEGTVQTANELGLLIKPKGKSSVDIIEADKIENVEYAPEKAKKLTAKYLKEITFGQARQHLLDRHGATLDEVNGLSEEDALAAHNGIDHEAEDLGHRHGEKPAATEADATEAESDADADE